MQIKTILRLLGILLTIFSFSMLTPIVISKVFHEHLWQPFLYSFILTFSVGIILTILFRTARQELKIRDGFLIVSLFWVAVSLFASLPFVFTINFEQGITDAVFETFSGLTTTGASVIAHIEGLPNALLFYRQQLQFLGGMGMIVLAVAILPMLGVGGMQLYRTETPGPMKDTKLTPRIAQTAKAIWSIYVFLTLLCTFIYWLLGMDWFDALGESFATVSTGGFAMHDASFAFYKSDLIELAACFFMILGATNFSLHFLTFKKGSFRHYWADEEFRFFISILLIASIAVTGSLVAYKYFNVNASHHAFVKSLFNVISLSTTTGFVSAPVNSWPTYVPVLLMILAILGGCAASTSGGVKMMRGLLLYKQSKKEMARLLHPNAVVPVKFGRQTLPEHILESMWGFISVFIALFLFLMVLLIAMGNDFLTSFSAITATLANAGVGVGSVSFSFITLNLPSKWLLIFAMLAGRLEIFSLLLLFSRHFWQK
jgi:trk system potassium uptake protein TrkH